MKKLLTIIFIFIVTSCYSQIGMHQDDVLDTYRISRYKVNTYSYELVSETDTLLTIFSLDLSTRKVFSIEYMYPTVERLNMGLKTALNETVEISKNVYLRDKTLFMVNDLKIHVLDVKYINKYK